MREVYEGCEGIASNGKALSRRDFLRGLAAIGLGRRRIFDAPPGGFRERQSNVNTARLDPVECLAYEKLTRFIDWTKREGVRGYIGEIGWPNRKKHGLEDERKWNALADKWYGWADEANLWVTAHDANERQVYGGYYMSIYTSVGKERKRALSVAKPQAQVLEAHPDSGSYKRGLNMPSGQGIERGVFHQGNLGTFNEVGSNCYWYSGVANDGPDGRNSFEYLRERNVSVARLGFRWERFMPGGPGTKLDETELKRYKASVDAARKAGLEVILDVHNYGGYWFEENGRAVEHLINGSRVSIENFVDLWRQLSDRFKDAPAIIGYDLMNEPNVAQGRFGSEDLAWQDATQKAVSSIRKNEDGKLLVVPTYFGKGKLGKKLPKAWISDPANNLMYTAHQYFDTARGDGDTGGGRYKNTYDNEAARLSDRYPAPKPNAKDRRAEIRREERKRTARARRRRQRTR